MGILDESQLQRDKELAYLSNKSLTYIQKIRVATPDSIRVFNEDSPELKPEEYINLYKSYKYLNMLAYLKTLMKTSATRRHKELFNLLRKTKNKICLDYGSGVGTHSIALLENNNEVTLYDVEGSELQHFAVHRLMVRGLHCHVLMHTDELPNKNYDVVVCSDTLEHVESPVRELKRIYNTMKPNGILHLLVSTMRKPSSGHFNSSIDEWLSQGILFMDKYFIKEGQTIYRRKRWVINQNNTR